MKAKATLKRVHGRVKAMAAGNAYVFELRREVKDKATGEVVQQGGVVVRRKCTAKARARVVTFEELVGGGEGLTFEADKMEYAAAADERGVRWRQKGMKKWREVTWQSLLGLDPALTVPPKRGTDDSPNQYRMPFMEEAR